MRHSIAPRVYADLVGKPYADGGRGPHAYDCVGLALELQRRLGRKLPPYLSDEDSLHTAVAEGGELHESQRIDAPEAGCLVLMREGLGCHIGCMIDDAWMLHTYRKIGSAVRQPLQRSLFRSRVMGFYRTETSA